MSKARYKILDEQFKFRVVNGDGEAELGTWHIADFSSKKDAEFFVKCLELRNCK